MATLAELTQRVKNKLYGAYPTDRPFNAELAASHDNAIATITVDDGTNWDAGDILENDGTKEQMYVKSVATDVLTVIRGFNGTTKTASAGTDDLITKNPRFSGAKITDALNTSLASLGNWGIHGFDQGEFTRDDMQKDFWEVSDTDIFVPYGVLEAYYVETNTLQARGLPFRWHAGLGAGPTEYSTGYGLLMLDFGQVKLNEKVHYVYAKEYQILSEPAGGEQEELLVIGATTTLMGGQIAPATQDPGARTDRTTPVGQLGRDVRFHQGEYFQRIRTEAALVAVQRDKFLPSDMRYRRARRWRP